jgi:TonB family protein
MCESDSRKIWAAAIVLSALSATAFAASELKPGPDEAIVVYEIRTPPDVHQVEFRRIGTHAGFTMMPITYAAQNPEIVKAGRYFLSTYRAPRVDLARTLNKEPTDERDSFQVLPGTVTYIGDWVLDYQKVYVLDNRGTLDRARKSHPWLEKYPLYVAVQGHQPISVSWTQVQAPKKLELRLNGLPVRLHAPHDYYPQDARKLGLAGRVELAYSVNAQGNPERITALVSDDQRFEAAAAEALRDVRFELPADWVAQGGPWRRLHLQVTFAIEGSKPLPPYEDGLEALTVIGSRPENRQ